MLSNLVVQKYGGATLATPELVKAAAKRLAEQSQHGPLIAVVSAMGTTTNSLLDLASQVSPRPFSRELDMLLSVGERISMSLLSMALNDLGKPAISFTGSQAGILTDDSHFNARILDIRPPRVEAALREGKIVILAGFQGVSAQTKEITTLGRGGSDVTAVAMAAALGAARCEILKEVPGVFSADPRCVPEARMLRHLTYAQLVEMTFWGAKVLHYRSAELAAVRQVPLYLGPAADPASHGTLIGKGDPSMEQSRALSINSHEHVVEIEVENLAEATLYPHLRQEFEKRQMPVPQLLRARRDGTRARLLLAGPKEVMERVPKDFADGKTLRCVSDQLSTVTITCTGSTDPALAEKIAGLLGRDGLEAREWLPTAMSLTLVLGTHERERALRALHSLT